MARTESQKMKLLVLNQLMHDKTDEEHRLNAEQLISELAENNILAERKSIYGDIAALQEFGLDIIATKGRNAGYYLADRTFELAELKLLVDATQCARFITEQKSKELIRKISKLASVYQAQNLQRQVYVAGRAKTANEQVYYNVDAIHEAISSNRKISYRYFEYGIDFSKSKKVTKHYRHEGGRYLVSPWALTWDDEKYYLIAYDGASEKIRHYRVDKIENIEVVQEGREGRKSFETFNLAAYTRKHFGMFSGDECKVVLQCKNSFIGVIHDRFGDDVFLSPDRESPDCFRATVEVAISTQFFGWIFGMGGGITILEPTEIREQFMKQLKTISEL